MTAKSRSYERPRRTPFAAAVRLFGGSAKAEQALTTGMKPSTVSTWRKYGVPAQTLFDQARRTGTVLTVSALRELGLVAPPPAESASSGSARPMLPSSISEVWRTMSPEESAVLVPLIRGLLDLWRDNEALFSHLLVQTASLLAVNPKHNHPEAQKALEEFARQRAVSPARRATRRNRRTAKTKTASGA